MSRNLKTLLEAPVIELDSIDSTNNYAMQLVDADTAQPGMTIVTAQQTQGKGQRGRVWADVHGESVLMSIIATPGRPLTEQFIFNTLAATAIAEGLLELYEGWDVRIKWPNDVIINDKKAGGVLIENVLRGMNWLYSIIGFGLNVKQAAMPAELPYATSLAIASGKVFDVTEVRDRLRERILRNVTMPVSADIALKQYNDVLYRKGAQQKFSNDKGEWVATVLRANIDGTLQVQNEDGRIEQYTHGQVLWNWA